MKKSRRFLCIILSFAVVLTLHASEQRPGDGADRGTGREIIRDTLFEKGVGISPLHPDIVFQKGGFVNANTDTLYFERQDVLPVWQLSQWHSRYDLANARQIRNEDGSVEYGNPGKRIVRYPDGSLLLDIITSAEYDRPRKGDEAWPHLLVEQVFEKNPNVGEAEEMIFSMALKLVKCENKMSAEEFDEGLHTAQSPFYFFLMNTNSESEDFNQSLWFGIQSFDYRYPRMFGNEVVSWDVASKMYIYNVPQTAIWGDISFHDMEWHETQTDILPLIKQAVEAMKSKGMFLGTSLSDLELVGMNIGWEVPGTFDAAVLVKGISLKVTE